MDTHIKVDRVSEMDGQSQPATGSGREVLSRKEAAEFLRVSVRTLDRLAIPRTYVGRSPKYLRDDLMEFLLARRVEGPIDTPKPKPAPRLSARPDNSARDWLRSRLDSL